MGILQEVSRLISTRLVDNDVVDCADIEVYQYGIELTILKYSHIILFVIVGLYFDCLIEFIMFTVLFKKIRENSGGYHAKTPTRCFAVSCFISVSLVLLVNSSITINFYLKSNLLLLMILGVLILLLSPVASSNKSLNDGEYTILKRKVVFILLVYFILYCILYILRFYTLSIIVVYVEIITLILLIISYITQLNTRSD